MNQKYLIEPKKGQLGHKGPAPAPQRSKAHGSFFSLSALALSSLCSQSPASVWSSDHWLP